METKTFQVPNIGCGGCVRTIESEIGALTGVQSVKGAVDTKMVTVTYGAPSSWDNIVAKLTELDYAPAQA